MFGLGGWDFTVRAADVDETPIEGESPREYVVRLAKAKALATQARAGIDALVIGSDTTVADGDRILGKPVDDDDARRMLKQLRGRTHQVFTAIAVLHDGKMVTELSVTDVPMRGYSDAEIEAYIQTGDPLDKAGAYAIQHAGFQPVESMAGCYASVMGLPLCHLLRALRRFDIAASAEVPAACQSLLKYDCKVSPAILAGELVN